MMRRKWAADVLRRLADSIERNEFSGQDGHHPLLDNVGKKVGELYRLRWRFGHLID
jgi:hypothetical protein